MEQQMRGRSSSSTGGDAQHQRHKSINGHSPSPARFPNPVQQHQQQQQDSNASVTGLGIEFTSAQYPADLAFDPSNSFSSGQQAQAYPPQPNPLDPSGAIDLNQDYTQQIGSEANSYGGQAQETYSQQLLSSNFGDDFSLFPPASGDQFNAPSLFPDNQQLEGADDNMMATMVSNPNQPGSSRQSPAHNLYNVPTFQTPSGHSRHASLQPEMAFLPRQFDFNTAGPQFQGHRRNPSDISDVSSVAPSPNLSVADAFDLDQRHSPMHLPQDAGMHADLQGITNFSISDHGAHSPNLHNGRSPSHSPAVSPRILPQQMPDLQQQQQYLMQVHHNASYGPPASYPMQAPEAFPTLPSSGPDIQVPNIQVDYAPTHGLDQPNKSALDADSLTPPDRGRPKQRQRAVTDPFNTGASHLGHNRTTSGSGSLSPNVAGIRSDSSRSMSPLDRSGSGAGSLSPSPSPLNRRRQSTSSVPNNAIALRLAGEEGYISTDIGGPGGTKGRVQKHPATFQCDQCPKRFTRAYNLRSHLRTHTNERPFKCTVCGKEFARQHDRKRHESLHSGEKKFVCKGELRAGVQWGCGRKFARADALGRHFRSEAGRVCIKPLLDEERQQQFNEQMQQQAAQGMVMAQQATAQAQNQWNMDPNTNAFILPQALISQFPWLAQPMADSMQDMGGDGSGLEDDHSGVSNFEASDYDGEDGGYVSGPGTGYGAGGGNENFGVGGYASDYGGR